MSSSEIQIPNLLGGVSQQGILRLPNQFEQQDNAWASPVDGMRKRHPTDHLAKLLDAPSARQAKIHTIVRGIEQYVVALLQNEVRVFYPDGAPIGVYAPGGGSPDFQYLNGRATNWLLSPENFSVTHWSQIDAAMPPTSTAVRGPLGFGSAMTLGNAWDSVGDEGIYRQAISGTATDDRKHLSVYVRAVNDDEETFVRLEVREAVLSPGCSFTYSVANGWVAGVPDTDVLADTEQMGDGWYRLRMTYQPDAVSPSPVTEVDIQVHGSGVLGPDKLVQCWGALLKGSDYWSGVGGTFPNYLKTIMDDMRATSVQDFTFVVNRRRPVQKGTTLSAAQPGGEDQAFVWVRQGAYSQDYTVRVRVGSNPTRAVTVSTWDGVTTGGGVLEEITTQEIAAALADNSTGLGQYADLTVDQSGSVIRIRSSTPGELITVFLVQSPEGGERMVGIHDEVAIFSDLPLEFIDGMRIRVAGDPSRSEDDYWVEFQEDAGADGVWSTGKWHETAAPEILIDFDDSSMPHQLVRKYDDGAGTVTGTPAELYFEWGPTAWTSRVVGDDDSNPYPSFVSDGSDTRYIWDVFFHRGRLGFLSDSNVIFSSTSDLFSFWRSSVRGILDGDRIDVAAAHRQVAKLHAAIPVDRRLLLFSSNTVFSIAGNPLLTPRSVEAPPVLEEESSRNSLPAAMGSSVLFASDKGDYSIIQEAFPLTERTTFRAQELTAPVPRFIEGSVRDIEGTTLEGEMVVAIRADGDFSKLYIYKSFNDGRERVQSAFWRYPMGDGTRLVGFGWLGERLVLAIERNDALYLESMTVGSGIVDPDSGFQVCLDRRVTEATATPTFTVATGTTDYAMPYDVTSAASVRVVTRATAAGEGGIALQVVDVDTTPGANVVKVFGDHAAEAVWIGEAYTMTFDPGRPVVRSKSVTGGLAPRLEGGELFVGGAIWLSGPAHIDVVVTREYGESNRERLRGPHLGSGPILGEVRSWARRHEFSVLAQPDEATVHFESDSHLSTKLEALEWYLSKQGRSRRLRR